ncbi:hypothetical protein FGO68_gene7405 [Halteria grandinella]|uniref:Uncharacterized protein n=1 Tax=Halteria grandinella TaxID=5974 RepID=A0A8J8T082_HALGN|nr:hypothetical protein FGO68_gene7405 [Halteria grandinella]
MVKGFFNFSGKASGIEHVLRYAFKDKIVKQQLRCKIEQVDPQCVSLAALMKELFMKKKVWFEKDGQRLQICFREEDILCHEMCINHQQQIFLHEELTDQYFELNLNLGTTFVESFQSLLDRKNYHLSILTDSKFKFVAFISRKESLKAITIRQVPAHKHEITPIQLNLKSKHVQSIESENAKETINLSYGHQELQYDQQSNVNKSTTKLCLVGKSNATGLCL